MLPVNPPTRNRAYLNILVLYCRKKYILSFVKPLITFIDCYGDLDTLIIMVFISHRGNVNGANPGRENSPDYINEALAQNYHVEIDVWYKDDGFWLGHDKPQYATVEAFLENEKLWCHAKNLPALEKMLENKKIHCFWHQEDDLTLTAKNIMWTYPGKELTPQSVCVMPELQGIKSRTELPKCFGICSDFISNFK